MPNTFENIKVIWNNRAIQPVYPKGDQSWVFIGRTDVEAETPILGPPDTKSWLIGKDPDAEKDGGQEEKGMTEDEMVGWHYRHGWWTWVWVDSGRWWWTGRPGVLQFTGSQRVGHVWATEPTEVKLEKLLIWALHKAVWFCFPESLLLKSVAWIWLLESQKQNFPNFWESLNSRTLCFLWSYLFHKISSGGRK